jgi:hypothetical protein
MLCAGTALPGGACFKNTMKEAGKTVLRPVDIIVVAGIARLRQDPCQPKRLTGVAAMLGGGGAAAGEITKVTHMFQPSGLR